MRALLDTHVFLWWNFSHGTKISEKAMGLLGDGDAEMLLSVASLWEIAIKVAVGRLELPGPVAEYLPERIRHHGFEALSIDARHAFQVASLPHIHRDPFDRLIVAQAQVEGIPILTADPAIALYDVETIW